MSELRILEAITPSRIGGAEVYVADACARLPELGAQVELFCPKDRPFAKYAAARGLSPITWKTHGKIDPITVIKLACLIKKHNIDVIHTHLSTASMLGAFAAKLARVPSVAHVHGFNTATCFKHSDVVIAVSEGVKAHLQAQGLSEKKIRVVHNGVNLAKFTPLSITEAKRKFGFDEAAPVFGVFGRLSDEKGQRVAIEAMFLVLKSCAGAQLIIAGEGKNEADLKAAAEALGIKNNVHFPGFVENVPQLMSACDVVLVPSVKNEGFGLAAIEAMALERPVVASNLGGLAVIVAPGETGFLVAPNDPESAAEAMEHLIHNKPAAESMGKQGRRRVEEHFDQKKQMALLLSIIREMVKR